MTALLDDDTLARRTQAILTDPVPLPRPCIVQRVGMPALEGLGIPTPEGLRFLEYSPDADWWLIPAAEIRARGVTWAPETCRDCAGRLPHDQQVYALTSPDLGRCPECLEKYLTTVYGVEAAAEWRAGGLR